MRIHSKTLLSVLISASVLSLVTAPASRAQSPLDGGGYVELETANEIALARSAAPSSVSEDASIWLLKDGAYSLSIEGSNQNHCLVMRSYPKSLEPLCYDEEGSRTILPIELRRFELRLAGNPWTEIDAIIDREVAAGRLSAPKRPAMSYMLSSAQDLYARDGRNVGAWKPHLMLYVPEVTVETIGLMAGPTSDLLVADPGTPLAHVIIVVPEFVDPMY